MFSADFFVDYSILKLDILKKKSDVTGQECPLGGRKFKFQMDGSLGN